MGSRRSRSNNRNRRKKSEAFITTKLPHQTTRICELSDDILVSILTLLPLKEAGVTSILSKRWRHVWEYIPTLNLDGSGVINKLVKGKPTIEQKELEIHRYIRWVDQVVSSHKAPTLDEFRLQFDFNMCPELEGKIQTYIHCWTRFAMEKRVKRLTLNLSYRTTFLPELRYTIPNLFCNSLTYLELNSIHISGEVLESLLCNCLALEYLSVTFSVTLEVLRVAGPSLSLKYLKILFCRNIQRLEISAPNLVSFCYDGLCETVQFQSLPKLVEVYFQGKYIDYEDCGLGTLGCFLLQIEVLKLKWPDIIYRPFQVPTEYPVFERLKKLDVEVCFTRPGYDFFHLLTLIKACPFLHHLKLQVTFLPKLLKRRMRKWEPYPHYNMKIVEFPELNQVHTRRRAREQAELFVRPVLKPGTDLVII